MFPLISPVSALPAPPTPVPLVSPVVAQRLVDPADPRINKLFDLQRAAFNHVVRVMKVPRSGQVTIDRFQAYVEWGAAICFIKERPSDPMGYQVTIIMQWDDRANRWAYRGVADGSSVEEFMGVGMPAENAQWISEFL